MRVSRKANNSVIIGEGKSNVVDKLTAVSLLPEALLLLKRVKRRGYDWRKLNCCRGQSENLNFSAVEFNRVLEMFSCTST